MHMCSHARVCVCASLTHAGVVATGVPHGVGGHGVLGTKRLLLILGLGLSKVRDASPQPAVVGVVCGEEAG